MFKTTLALEDPKTEELTQPYFSDLLFEEDL